jgi:hypothetical protein
MGTSKNIRRNNTKNQRNGGSDCQNDHRSVLEGGEEQDKKILGWGLNKGVCAVSKLTFG